MRFALVTNVLLVLETNTLKARVQTSAQHSYTAIFKLNFSRNRYSQALTFEKGQYYRFRTHLRVRYTHKFRSLLD